MRFCWNICLAALLIFGFINTASADASLKRFFGSYSGFGSADNLAGAFINTERDFELTIRPLEPDGFEVSWITVKRKGNNPNALKEVISHHASSFRPSGNPGIYHDVDNGNPLDGDLLSWARLHGNSLIVYRFMIQESGILELHIYRRMLTAKGLELVFYALQDDRIVRTVKGRYRRE